MKVTSILKRASIIIAAFTLMSVYAFAPKVSAVPYDPNHPGAQTPTFNMYTGTPSVGDESDFLRGKEEGTTGYINDVNSACNNGQKFNLRVYVHNGANETLNNNGSGPGVAKNTKVRVQLPNSAMDKFALNSTISASNAASVSDGMSINCNGKVVRLSYVAGTASQYTVPGGNKALSDSIVTTGAPIGTHTPNGDVWGCWDQRVWVTLTVKVEEVPPKPQPSEGVCKILLTEVTPGRRVNTRLEGEVNNATITGYKVDFGDGNSTDQQTATHTYAQDGTYTLTGEVRVKYADGREEWKGGEACKGMVKFEGDKPPVVTNPTPTPTTPSVLPETGPAGVGAIVAFVTAASSAAYHWVARRRGVEV